MAGPPARKTGGDARSGHPLRSSWVGADVRKVSILSLPASASPKAPRADRRRGAVRALLGWSAGLLLAGSLVSLLWSWREESRPGARHYLRGLEQMAGHNPRGALDEGYRGIRA